MLISFVEALLPLVAVWLAFRRCLAQAKVLLYAEKNNGTQVDSRDYL